MTPLRLALGDYLSVRRALGYKLDREGKVLDRFLAYLEERGAQTITVGVKDHFKSSELLMKIPHLVECATG
jgi:hypothetical protein